MPVGNEDVAVGIERDVARTDELITRTTRARRAGPRASGWRGRWIRRRHSNGDRFRFTAENHQHTPLRIELDDLARSLVNDPDVVLRVDMDGMRDLKRVNPLSNFTHECTAAIELQQTRASMREQSRIAERDGRIARTRVHEQLSTRVRRDARDFTEIKIRRQLEEVRRGVKRDLRNGCLRLQLVADVGLWWS